MVGEAVDETPQLPFCPVHDDVRLESREFLPDDYEADYLADSSLSVLGDGGKGGNSGDSEDGMHKPWKYVKCPKSRCFMTCGQDGLDEYLKATSNEKKLLRHYVKGVDSLRCQCDDPVRLSLSKSESNPLRLYFTCRGNSCRYFQWADRLPRNRLNRPATKPKTY